MIGIVSRQPDPPEELAARIRAALSLADAGTQAYLRFGARLDRVCAVHIEPGGLAWRSRHAAWNRPWITGLGPDPTAVSHSVGRLAAVSEPAPGFTVERRAFHTLPAALRPDEHWEWDWWFTSQPPESRPGEALVVDVAPDDPRVPALLQVANPDAMVRPGDPRISGWFAIPAGALGGAEPLGHDVFAAVAAVTTMRPGVAHLGSVATHPRWRGRGLSRDLCARLTRDALADGSPAVTLGMHAANGAARSVYASLGYSVGHRWSSGRLGPGR
jgi:GNAT superfamily N-acetyltransferase